MLNWWILLFKEERNAGKQKGESVKIEEFIVSFLIFYKVLEFNVPMQQLNHTYIFQKKHAFFIGVISKYLVFFSS